jgi:hypothetical protein
MDLSRGLGDVYKRQVLGGNVKSSNLYTAKSIPGY